MGLADWKKWLLHHLETIWLKFASLQMQLNDLYDKLNQSVSNQCNFLFRKHCRYLKEGIWYRHILKTLWVWFHCNKVNIAIEWVTWVFWFPSACIKDMLILCCCLLPFCVLSRSLLSDSLQFHGLYVACQAPLSMGFSRQEYCSGFPCPSPGDFADPGIERMSLKSPALAGGFFITCAPWEAQFSVVAKTELT